MFQFETMRLGWRPNQFLMAPSGLCRHSKPHTLSPTYDVPRTRLRIAFMAIVERQPRIELVDQTEDAAHLIQRSRTFGFPDIIDVRFMKLGEERSTVAMYSRARYGIRDFGVNRARVRNWLDQLHIELKT